MRVGDSADGLHAPAEAGDADASRHGGGGVRGPQPPLLRQPGPAGQAGAGRGAGAVPARAARGAARAARQPGHDQGADRQGAQVDEPQPAVRRPGQRHPRQEHRLGRLQGPEARLVHIQRARGRISYRLGLI